jgi:hypothetical protein
MEGKVTRVRLICQDDESLLLSITTDDCLGKRDCGSSRTEKKNIIE